MRLVKLLILTFFFTQAYAEQISLCDSTKGLELINQNNYSLAQIEMILAGCDKVSPNNPQVLLLHGLLARKQAHKSKNYLPAIEWLEKANVAAPDNLAISLELAATYELSNNFLDALNIYKSILSNNKTNRTALLGMARIYRIQKSFNEAIRIYNQLLSEAPHDIDALNGLAWVKIAQNEIPTAKTLFQESLKIQTANQDALLGLNAIKQADVLASKAQHCNASLGLILLNQVPVPILEIQKILKNCDNNHIDNTESQLLHGLLARHLALTDQNYNKALFWLQKAMNSATKTDKGPALELALTYEWTKQLSKAKTIYDYILAYEPTNRGALLGKGRVLRLEHLYADATNIYQQLLRNNPQDVDAINGLGWIQFSEKNFQNAKAYFNQTLAIQMSNREALIALNQIKAEQLTQPAYAPPCPLVEGLKLINSKKPAIAEIEAILKQCENANFEDMNFELLSGLLARQKAQSNKDYKKAIFWLLKARQSAAISNKIPALELALTYEQANQEKMAREIYQQILIQDPENEASLLGLARIFRSENQFQRAQKIYQVLLKKNTKNIDALNGMGWVELARNNLALASRFFESSLSLQSTNEEADIALKKIAYLKAHPPTQVKKPLCNINQAAINLNQKQPDFVEINKILQHCDKAAPNSTDTLMLHALVARYYAQKTNNYDEAIAWFRLAVQSADSDNKGPLFELAVTYERANKLQKALVIYQQLLFTQPNNITAALGQARVLRAMYLIKPSITIYNKILEKNPRNIEALIGLGETVLTNYEFDKAGMILNRALTLDSQNKQTQHDIAILNNATKNILGITGGHSAVPPNTSENINLFYFRNLNATDGLTVYATHNTKQIESNFSSGPTLLPNNSLLIGYQHLIPNQYGWQLSYDARQHNRRPFENRVFGSTDIFLNKNFQWFNGLRLIFPEPWNTQLLISGITAYTPLPFNITATGFWSYQQIGGKSASYALDFSKEFSNRFFYDIGPSYLPREKSWEIHGRVIIPTFKNQALVAEYSHYLFNRSTFATAGWRFYWA